MKKNTISIFILSVFVVFVGVFVIKSTTKYYKANALAQVNQSVSKDTTTRNVLSQKERIILTNYLVANNKLKYIEKTISGRLVVYFEEKENHENAGDSMKVALVSGRDFFEIDNISGFVDRNWNGKFATLSGFVSPTNKTGNKEIIVNLSQEKIKTFSQARLNSVRNRDNRDVAYCNGGEFCSLVVSLDLTGGQEELPASNDIKNYIFNGRIKNTLSEESYGQFDYNGYVTPWISVPYQNINIFGLPYEAEQYLISNGVDIGLFDQVLILVNGSMNNSGFASVGNSSFYFNNTDYQIPVAVVGFQGYFNDFLSASNGNMTYFDYLVVHEAGHNVGAVHDNLLDCQNGPESLPSECLLIEYGNKYSIMGDGSYGGHFSAWNKFLVGWVGSSNMIFSSNGTYSLDDIENENPSFLGLDINSSSVPEFLMERRNPLGIDALSLFQNLNLNGVFLYKQINYPGLNRTQNPQTWNMALVDTTPPFQSQYFSDSISDTVFKTGQRFTDPATGLRFAQNLGGDGNTIVVSPPILDTLVCTRNPIKVFEPENNSGDTFTSQIQKQKWPNPTDIFGIASNLVQDVQTDVSNQYAQVFLSKNIVLFNDDTPFCGNGEYAINVFYNGNSIPLISNSVVNIEPWTGWNFQSIYLFFPTYGLNYGNQTITLKITKINDETVFSKDLIFNLVP